jgi:hypothetical protein
LGDLGDFGDRSGLGAQGQRLAFDQARELDQVACERSDAAADVARRTGAEAGLLEVSPDISAHECDLVIREPRPSVGRLGPPDSVCEPAGDAHEVQVGPAVSVLFYDAHPPRAHGVAAVFAGQAVESFEESGQQRTELLE